MNRSLDIDLLRSFHLACALGTLSAVAERRHLTLGAVSQQIKRLEQQLDRPLLVRAKTGLRLTAEGAQLRAQSAALVNEHDALLNRLIGQPVAGVVELGLPEEYVPSLLNTLLPMLRQTHPRVRLHVRTANSGELQRALDRGELDLAIVVGCEDDTRSNVPLWKTHPVWASAAHPETGYAATLPLALHPEDCPYRAVGLAALETMSRSWETVFASGSVAAIESAVVSGLAISVLDQARLTSEMRELGVAEGLPPLSTCVACLAESPGISANDAEAVRLVAEQLQGVAFNSRHFSPDRIESNRTGT